MVDLSRPEKNLFSRVCCHLKTVLEQRYVPEESDSWPLAKTDGLDFAVVHCPQMRNRPILTPIFTMAIAEPNVTESINIEDSLTTLMEIPLASTVSFFFFFPPVSLIYLFDL